MSQIEKANFTEKEYEFAFNHEFVNEHSHYRDFSYIMPNLRQEARLAYDTRFDWIGDGFQYSKFFQYKIPNYVIKPKRTDSDIRDFFNGPYFTYEIRKTTRSQQHLILYLLSRGGEDVSYASPCFFRRRDFLEIEKNNSVQEKSIFFDPKDIPILTDDRHHFLSYNSPNNDGIFKSESIKIPSKKIDKTKKQDIPKLIDEEYVKTLYRKLVQCIKDTYQLDPTARIPKKVKEGPIILSCIYLINEYFKMKWILYGD
jgi:hypothetical protein